MISRSQDVRMRKVGKYIDEEEMRRSSRKEFKRNIVRNRTNHKNMEGRIQQRSRNE
jgi:hypothetical protein